MHSVAENKKSRKVKLQLHINSNPLKLKMTSVFCIILKRITESVQLTHSLQMTIIIIIKIKNKKKSLIHSLLYDKQWLSMTYKHSVALFHHTDLLFHIF